MMNKKKRCRLILLKAAKKSTSSVHKKELKPSFRETIFLDILKTILQFTYQSLPFRPFRPFRPCRSCRSCRPCRPCHPFLFYLEIWSKLKQWFFSCCHLHLRTFFSSCSLKKPGDPPPSCLNLSLTTRITILFTLSSLYSSCAHFLSSFFVKVIDSMFVLTKYLQVYG